MGPFQKWPSRLAMLALYSTMVIYMTAKGEKCGTQEQFSGFKAGHDITYQVIRQNRVYTEFAIGGTVNYPSTLATGITKTYYSPTDSKAAIILAYKIDKKDPKRAALLSTWPAKSVKIHGVRALDIESFRVIAVLETDQDSTKFVLAYLDFTLDQASLATASISNLDYDTVQVHSYNHNNLYLLVDQVTGWVRSLYSVKFDGKISQGGRLEFNSFAKVVSSQTDHKLTHSHLNKNYLFRTSVGTCVDSSAASFSEGILLTVLDSIDCWQNIDSMIHQLCFNSQDPTLSFDGQSDNFLPVGIATHTEDKDTALVLQRSDDLRKYFYVAWVDYSTGQISNFHSYASNANAQMRVLAVNGRDNAAPGTGILVDVLLFRLNKYFLIGGISKGGSFTSLYVTIIEKVKMADEKYADVGNFLGLSYSQSSRLLLIGKDWLLKFPTVPADESAECINVGLITNAELGYPFFFSASAATPVTLETQSNSQPQLGTPPTNTDSGTEVPTSQLMEITEADNFYEDNVCQKDVVKNLWAINGYTKNLLHEVNYDVGVKHLQIGVCAVESFTNDLADVKYQLVSYEYDGVTRTDWDKLIYEEPDTAGINNKIKVISNVDNSSFEGGKSAVVSYRAGLQSQSDAEIALLPLQSFTIGFQLRCNIGPVSKLTSDSVIEDGFTYIAGDQKLTLTFEQPETGCSNVLGMFNEDGTPADSNTIWSRIHYWKQWHVKSDDPKLEGTHKFRYKIQSKMRPNDYPQVDYPFQVTFKMSPCNKNWQYPTAAGFFNATYTIGEALKTIELTDVALDNCPYSLSLWNITDSSSPQEVSSSLVNLIQPILEPDLNDSRIVGVKTFGKITVETSEIGMKSISQLELRLISNRYSGDSEYRSMSFHVIIQPCFSVPEDSKFVASKAFEYQIGDPELTLPVVSPLNSTCASSYLTLSTPDIPEKGFKVKKDTETRQITVSILALSSEDLTVGKHEVRVDEIDLFTGKVAQSLFELTVKEQPVTNSTNSTVANNSTIKFNVTEQTTLEESDEPQNPANTTAIDYNSSSQEQKATDDGNSTEASSGIVTMADGRVIYPWQRASFQRQNQKKEQRITIEFEEKIVPLRASIFQISPTGLLTIRFNKPIIIPPIRVSKPVSLQISESKDTESNTRGLQDVGFSKYDIREVIDLHVDSSFYEEGSSSIQIRNLTCTRLTETEIDIQIDFVKPTEISQSALEPDSLVIEFKQPYLFMDEADATQLDPQIDIEYPLQPQMTEAELKQLKETARKVSDSVASVSWSLLLLQVILAFGLKYLWNIMNLLQFLIFMILWQIRLPKTTKILIGELRSLAFLEFIPSEWFKKVLRGIFGVEKPESQCRDDEAAICEGQGSEALGSSDLIENTGSMLFIAFAVLLIFLLLGLLGLAAKKYDKVRSLFKTIKKKLLYNSILRYVLQSTLKLQIAAFTIIFYESLSVIPMEGEKAVSTAKIVASWTLCTILYMCPLLFLTILIRNRSQLHKPEVQEKIGTLYNGLRPIPSVATHSFVFLVRRSIFVLLTFYLFDKPNLQVQGMILMTLFYITYVSWARFYESSSAKTLEIWNETSFCLIQYNFVLLNNLVEVEIAIHCGNSITVLTGLLLVINFLVILVVSAKAIFRKWQLSRMKKQYQLELEERMRAKALLEAQTVEAQTAEAKPVAINFESQLVPAEQQRQTNQLIDQLRRQMLGLKRSSSLHSLSSSQQKEEAKVAKGSQSSLFINDMSQSLSVLSLGGVPSQDLIEAKVQKNDSMAPAIAQPFGFEMQGDRSDMMNIPINQAFKKGDQKIHAGVRKAVKLINNHSNQDQQISKPLEQTMQPNMLATQAGIMSSLERNSCSSHIPETTYNQKMVDYATSGTQSYIINRRKLVSSWSSDSDQESNDKFFGADHRDRSISLNDVARPTLQTIKGSLILPAYRRRVQDFSSEQEEGNDFDLIR